MCEEEGLHSYGGPGVHSDIASAARPPMFRIVSAMFPQSFRAISARFLLGTGRMPHPVGGDMGVTLCLP